VGYEHLKSALGFVGSIAVGENDELCADDGGSVAGEVSEGELGPAASVDGGGDATGDPESLWPSQGPMV